MEDIVEEKVHYFEACKCCLSSENLNNMWEVLTNEGQQGSYGEMLTDCFAIMWEQSEVELICETCISRLQDAFSFRKQIIASHEQLESLAVAVKTEIKNEVSIKEDTEENSEEWCEIEYLDEDIVAADTPDPDTLSQGSQDFNPVQIVSYDDEEDEEYKNIEMLDDCVEDSDYKAEEEGPPKRGRGRRRVYRQYTEQQLRSCVDKVVHRKMKISQAVREFNIPRNTVKNKVKDYREGKTVESGHKAESQNKLIADVQAILTYTNATVFKTCKSRYHCLYCTGGPHYESADELREHTRQTHAVERVKAIDQLLRPMWMNEIVKIDIHNLCCTACCVVIGNWNEMLTHLTSKHGVTLDEAYSRAVPYCLSPPPALLCALCAKPFLHFHHLDAHMNAHYDNHICPQCGDSFVAISRLKRHMTTHVVGSYPCSECDKVFTRERYRTKHAYLVHDKRSTAHCLYCSESFRVPYLRHLHVMEKHPEHVTSITCDQCGEIFNWRPYYLMHVKRKHTATPKYECHYCRLAFHKHRECKRHMALQHSADEVDKCECGAVFTSKPAYKTHVKKYNHYTMKSDNLVDAV